MKFTKYLLTSILSLMLVLSLASAFSLSTTSDVVTQARNGTVAVTLNAGETVSAANSTLTSNGIVLGVSPTSLSSSGTFRISPQTVPSNLLMGSYPFTFSFSNNTAPGTYQTATVNFVKSFCSSGSVGGNLSIRSVDISSSGDDDDIWRPLDEVEVEVDVENIGDTDLNDIFVEIGLYDSNGKNYVGDLDFSSDDEEEFDIGDIDDGDKETATFEFKIPADFDFDLGNLDLVVKAYSDDLGQNKMCTDSTDDSEARQTIQVETNDDEGEFMAFDNIELSADDAVCSDFVTLTADVFNVGEDDEDQVRVTLSNAELGLESDQEMRSGLDVGDGREFSFTFQIPTDAREKTYDLQLSAEYDYRNGVYREESEDPTLVPLRVFGCSAGSSGTSIASISASLASDAVAGEPLTVSSRITNPTNAELDYVVSVRGYDDWASLESISTRSFTLGAGETRTVTIELTPNSDASGEQDFTIEVSSGDERATRLVSVEFPASTISGDTNWLLWGIILVNVILVIIIIAVAVKMSRR